MLSIKKYDNIEIKLEKNKVIKNELEKYGIQRNKLIEKIKNKKDTKNVFFKSRQKFSLLNDEIEKTYFDIFTNDEKYHKFYKDDFDDKDKNKYKNIALKSKHWIGRLYDSTYEQSEDSLKSLMKVLPNVFNNLQSNGNLLLYFYYPVPNLKLFLYLLTLYFNEVYIVGKNIIFCRDYINNIENINKLKDIIKNDYNYSIILPNSKKLEYKYIDTYFKYWLLYDIYWHLILYYDDNDKKIFLLNELNFINAIRKLRLNKSKYIEKTITKKIKDIDSYTKEGKINKKDNNFFKDVLKYDNTYENNFIVKNIEKKKSNNIILIGENNFIYNYVLKNKKIKMIIINNTKNNKKDEFEKLLNIKDEKSTENIKITKKNPNDVLFENLYKKNNIDCFIINQIITKENEYNELLLNIQLMEKILDKNGIIIILNTQFKEINNCILELENKHNLLKKIDAIGSICVFKKI